MNKVNFYILVSVFAINTNNRISVSNLELKRRAIDNGYYVSTIFQFIDLFESYYRPISYRSESKNISLLVVDILLFALED